MTPLIDAAIREADAFVKTDYDGDKTPMIGTKKALSLLKDEVQNHPGNINERVLRAMHDTGVAAVKIYYNSPLEEAIKAVNNELCHEIPLFKSLMPLGNEFNRGDPI